MGSASLLKSSKAKKYLCKYEVANLVFMLGKQKIQTDYSNILSIEYLNDYDFNIFALLKVTLRCDLRLKMWTLRHKRDLRAKLEINKVGMDLDVDTFITNSEKCIDGVYALYFNDEDEAIDTESSEKRLESNEGPYAYGGPDGESYHESQNTLEVFLVNPDMLKTSRAPCNKVYRKCTLQDAIGEMLTSSEHTNVLMSPIENKEVYNELLVPLNPAYKSLQILDQHNGLHSHGTMIYYDLDTLYVLDTDLSKVTACKKGEWPNCTIFVSSINEASPGQGMIRVPGQKVFYPTVTEMEINTQNFSIAKNAELGSEARIVVTDDTTVNLSRANQSVIDTRNEFVTYVKDAEKYAGDMMNARMEENECVLYINGENFDINAFTPNKMFQVVFEEPSKHERFGKNKYRLTYAYHMLKLQSDRYMESTHRLILKKVDGPIDPKKGSKGGKGAVTK